MPTTKKAITVTVGRYQLKLRSVGNPDFRQYAPISDPAIVFVDSLAEASASCRAYQSYWDLGGGNWPETFVLEGGRKVARISYNGRVWDMQDKEIKITQLAIEP